MANVEYKADLSGTHFVPPHQNPPPYVTQPQPGIYPAYPAVPPQQVVAVVPVVRQMGPDPSHYTCPSCNTAIVTRVERVSTTKDTSVCCSSLLNRLLAMRLHSLLHE
uniref:LITAF domain-containing protein n=1 Tax=Bombyx mori TaxID=7091 RepID=A0A8R2M9F2_BOMMO|nr:uncharacterized protein LOC119630888 [Bombyx mori]